MHGRNLRLLRVSPSHFEYEIDKIDQNRIIFYNAFQFQIKDSSRHQANRVTVKECAQVPLFIFLLSKMRWAESKVFQCVSLKTNFLTFHGKCQVESI